MGVPFQYASTIEQRLYKAYKKLPPALVSERKSHASLLSKVDKMEKRLVSSAAIAFEKSQTYVRTLKLVYKRNLQTRTAVAAKMRQSLTDIQHKKLQATEKRVRIA